MGPGWLLYGTHVWASLYSDIYPCVILKLACPSERVRCHKEVALSLGTGVFLGGRGETNKQKFKVRQPQRAARSKRPNTPSEVVQAGLSIQTV